VKTKIIISLALLCAIFGAFHGATGEPKGSDKESLQFIVIGDWGTQGSEGQKLVAAQMEILAATRSIDFIVTTGDNFYNEGVNSVDDPLWRSTFEDIYSQPALKDIPWYVTLGNHDYRGNIYAQIEYGKTHKNWILPHSYYSRDFRIDDQTEVRILFLDTNPFLEEYESRPDIYHHIEEQDTGAQNSWMYNVLNDSDVVWRIAVGHHPVYSAGYHGGTTALKNVFPKLFEQQKVQAYFAGHDHHLEHHRLVGRTNYFISGGGSRVRKVSDRKYSKFATSSLGFVHVELDNTCMNVSFINEKGEELYQTRQSFDNGTQCQ